MKLRIKNSTSDDEYVCKKAVKTYLYKMDELGNGSSYSPGCKIVDKYYVNYKYGSEPYWIYDVLVIDNVSMSKDVMFELEFSDEY